jgi:hypothetical protein
MGLHEYLSISGFAVLLFTLSWSYRYTRLGVRMAVPERRPRMTSLTQSLWVGVTVSGLGILFSMLLMFMEVGRLLYVFLRAPQGGAPVIQTQTYDPSTWASAIDMVSLLADLSLLAAEQMMMAITLWLLLRVTNSAKAYEGLSEKTEDHESSSTVP